MRHILFLLLLTCSELQAQQLVQSPVIMTFQDMEKNGIRLENLDSIFPNATHTDKKAGVFEGKKEAKFSKAWGGFYEDLMLYFSKQGLKWEQPTWCFNKIYFAADGSVMYWFFNFKKSDNIPASVQEAYIENIRKFSSTYKIKIKAKSGFTQCASVTFVNMEGH